MKSSFVILVGIFVAANAKSLNPKLDSGEVSRRILGRIIESLKNSLTLQDSAEIPKPADDSFEVSNDILSGEKLSK